MTLSYPPSVPQMPLFLKYTAGINTHWCVSFVQGGAGGKYPRRHVCLSRGYDVADCRTPQPSGPGSEISGHRVTLVGSEHHRAGLSISSSQAGLFIIHHFNVAFLYITAAKIGPDFFIRTGCVSVQQN